MILRAFPTARLLALVLAACPTQAGGQEALLANGDFQSDADEDGKPDHWAVPEGASAKVEGGNRFLRLHAQPEKMLMVYRAVAVRPGHKAYALSFRVRINQLEPGKKAWHDGRIILDFKDAAGEKLEPGPPHPNFRGTRDWQTRRVEFLAPAGAATLEILPAMFMVESGSFDLDDMALTATDPEPILQKQKEAEARRQAEIERRAARVKPQAPKAPADKLPPMLEVMGNQIRDANGKSVWLQGLAIPSMEWSAVGEHILESVRVAIDDWHANVIRLPVREDFWAGKGPWQNDGGAGYRQLLDDAVNVAGGRGVYVVVDLHRYRAPIQAHADFWQALAKKYKNHPAVLFELMNEPHDISWEVWRDGGAVAVEKKNTDALAENKQKLRTFESVGMQRLIDVIRKTGARNIVIVGGLDWGYDLSGVIEGFAVDDRGGNGVVYSSHVYPWKSDWPGKFLDVAKKHPVFIGECGATPEPMSFIPPERHEDPSTWAPDFLGLVQKYKLHWTGWSFHPRASPVLLKDWTYAPTPYWGAPAKRALAGASFELKRMR